MLAENCGSTSLSTSWPSNSDHISPTVSSPTRVTTPPISSSTVSVARRLSHQSCWVRGSLLAIAFHSPSSSIAQELARRRLVLHVVDAGADVDQRLEHRMAGDVLDALAVDVDLAAVANGVQVLLAGADHGALSPAVRAPTGAGREGA